MMSWLNCKLINEVHAAKKQSYNKRQVQGFPFLKGDHLQCPKT